MNTTKIMIVASLAMGLAFVTAPSTADSDASVDWKTYSLVAMPGDGMLSCTGLKNTIAQIEADVVQMDKVRRFIEHQLDTASGSSGSSFSGVHAGQKIREYHQMRSEVNASRQVARDRIAYLGTVLPQCRERTAP